MNSSVLWVKRVNKIHIKLDDYVRGHYIATKLIDNMANVCTAFDLWLTNICDAETMKGVLNNWLPSHSIIVISFLQVIYYQCSNSNRSFNTLTALKKMLTFVLHSTSIIHSISAISFLHVIYKQCLKNKRSCHWLTAFKKNANICSAYVHRNLQN